MPGVTNPVTMPLIGATSPMPSMPVMPPGSGQVPQVPLAQFGSPSSLGMFGNFTNVSHQMGSQMGYPNESNAPQSPNHERQPAFLRQPRTLEGALSRTHVLDHAMHPQQRLQLWFSGSDCRAFSKSPSKQCLRDAWKVSCDCHSSERCFK